jgi:hypothetical protein
VSFARRIPNERSSEIKKNNQGSVDSCLVGLCGRHFAHNMNSLRNTICMLKLLHLLQKHRTWNAICGHLPQGVACLFRESFAPAARPPGLGAHHTYHICRCFAVTIIISFHMLGNACKVKYEVRKKYYTLNA